MLFLSVNEIESKTKSRLVGDVEPEVDKLNIPKYNSIFST